MQSVNPDKKISVNFFQRKPRPGFSFSVEFIFEDVRNRLRDKIIPNVFISTYYNEKFLPKLYNIAEAFFRQTKGVNHITGEVHFLALLLKKKRTILTVLDCIMYHRKKGLSKWLVKKMYLSWPVRRSAYITSISEVTRQELIEITKCPPEKVTVIPIAVNPIFVPNPKVFNSVKPKILHIGVAENKNIFRLAEALQGIQCHLFLVGKLNETHLDVLSRNNIEFSYGYNLTQQELFEKYLECDMLSFISTFEGFGMPIVEANCVERVVITSNVSSMPEVAGSAACLVNPFNVNDMKQGFIKIINDSAYRESLLENGRINRLRYDPDMIAMQYYQLYQKAAGTK